MGQQYRRIDTPRYKNSENLFKESKCHLELHKEALLICKFLSRMNKIFVTKLANKFPVCLTCQQQRECEVLFFWY